jgi:hypothetical protein
VSGSWITSNFTTFNVLVAIMYSYKMVYNKHLDLRDLLIQGDDFVLLIDKEEDKHKLKTHFKEFNLRLKLSVKDISKFNEDIEFLGYIWNEYNEPYQTDLWIFVRSVYPERFSSIVGPMRVISRILSIIINVKDFRYLFRKLEQLDPKLREILIRGDEPRFVFYDDRGNNLIGKIPIYKFLRYGWRLL